MFALFYTAVIKYPNKLVQDRDVFSFIEIALCHIVAICLFLTAGTNPGFVDETETPKSRREKAKLFVG